MKLIDDPTTEQISNDSVVWIGDVFDHSKLDALLKKQTPAYIVNDHYNEIEISDYKIYCVPLFLASHTKNLKSSILLEQQCSTNYTFNFMINKKQVNRFLCMKLVELFELSDYDYTWSGIDNRFDMSDILNELTTLGTKSPLTNKEKSFLLAEIQIPPKFFWLGDEKITDWNIKHNLSQTAWNYGLGKMFSNSAISLITESLSFEKGTVFTEKTVYTILGKSFPLWVGGGRLQAEKFKEIGFDSFDDIIDHSYQYYDTLIERCYYAFKLNLPLLSDLDYAKSVRNKCIDRLEHNRQLLINGQVDKFCWQQIEKWPQDLKAVIYNRLKYWI
jgi:hypothetical protein